MMYSLSLLRRVIRIVVPNSTEVGNSHPDNIKDKSSINLKLIGHIEQNSHSFLQNILILIDIPKRTNSIQLHSPLFITRVEISIYPYHFNHLTRAGLGMGLKSELIFPAISGGRGSGVTKVL